MRSPLFDQANREQETGQRWTVQSSKMLRVALGPEVLAAQGAMVAYQGNIDFSYQGSRSLGGMIKKAATGEGGNLMRVSGQGEVFFARSAQNVFLLQLEGDAITVNTPSLLAFDAHLGYDIRMLAMPGSLPAGCSTSSFRDRAWWPYPPTVRRCFWTAPSSRPSLTRRRRSAGRRTCSRKSRAPSRWAPSLGAARVSPSS